MPFNKLTLLELNEINFEYVERYCSKYPKQLRNLSKLLTINSFKTFAESDYNNLEPWIQWVSAHTGKTFEEHGIFRLGDMSSAKYQQIYETLESNGIRVGAISPMNSINKLKDPAYFIPDPWTDTKSSSGFWSSNIHEMIKQTVNDNSQSKISLKSLIILILALIRFSSLKSYPLYFSLALSSLRRPWNKALFLDLLLHDIHKKFLKKESPDFTSVFFNAGAHIQHHYFFNSEFYDGNNKNPAWYIHSKFDPLFDMLKVYDFILESYIEDKNRKFLLATGLTQIPFEDRIFYYRLKNHEYFLKKIGLKFEKVMPRMTRDFLIIFGNKHDKENGHKLLNSLINKNNSKPLFGEIENRENSLFVTLTYPDEITTSTTFSSEDLSIQLFNDIVFVALKNGKHCSDGYLFSNFALDKQLELNSRFHIKELFNIIVGFFKTVA